MMLVDLSPWNITGRDAELALGRAGLTVNKNAVPFDQRGPAVTSGIRIGTPFVTSRGMGEAEMIQIGALIVEVLKHLDDTQVLERTRAQVTDLCEAFPLYAE